MTLIELSNVGRMFPSGDDEISVLTGINLAITAGEFVAVMGPSGSGKSTLMNILGCLDRPSGGTYRIDGVDVAGLAPDALAELRRNTFGFIFQRYNLMPDLDALENAAIPAVYAGVQNVLRLARARDLLTGLGLGDRLHHRPHQLSGGQQQRVSIARALMNGGAVILADEPTGALDSRSGDEVMDTLHALHREGHTIILITHDAAVARHAERIIRIADGRIVADERAGAAAAVPPSGIARPDANGAPSAVLTEALKMALRSLLHNRLRTALTMLGIVIGVGSVVAMLAIGNGAKQEVLERIKAMGSDLITVKRGIAAVRGSGRGVVTLTPEDLPVLSAVPGVVTAVPETDKTVLLRFGNIDLQLPAVGTSEAFPFVHNWPVRSGTFFTAEDVRHHAQVVALGKTVADELFPNGQDPIGKLVIIGNAPFQVVATMSEKGVSGGGQNRDYTVWVPYTTAATRLFGQRFFESVNVKVGDGALLGQVERAVHKVLIAQHGKEDFNVRNQADLIETASQTQNTLTYLLAAIAVISLIVGGIGVMNIMLVSVTERTREIGIRMAVGARRRDVLVQFLTEAVLVCVFGGVVGILLGMAGGLAAARFMDWLVVFTVAPIILAFCCALLTGVVFGFLPARKAARLDPVEALARE